MRYLCYVIMGCFGCACAMQPDATISIKTSDVIQAQPVVTRPSGAIKSARPLISLFAPKRWDFEYDKKRVCVWKESPKKMRTIREYKKLHDEEFNAQVALHAFPYAFERDLRSYALMCTYPSRSPWNKKKGHITDNVLCFPGIVQYPENGLYPADNNVIYGCFNVAYDPDTRIVFHRFFHINVPDELGSNKARLERAINLCEMLWAQGLGAPLGACTIDGMAQVTEYKNFLCFAFEDSVKYYILKIRPNPVAH